MLDPEIDDEPEVLRLPDADGVAVDDGVSVGVAGPDRVLLADAVPDWLGVSEAESVAVQLVDGEEVPLAVPELLRVSVCVADCVGDAEADAVTDWLGLTD